MCTAVSIQTESHRSNIFSYVSQNLFPAQHWVELCFRRKVILSAVYLLLMGKTREWFCMYRHWYIIHVNCSLAHNRSNPSILLAFSLFVFFLIFFFFSSFLSSFFLSFHPSFLYLLARYLSIFVSSWNSHPLRNLIFLTSENISAKIWDEKQVLFLIIQF